MTRLWIAAPAPAMRAGLRAMLAGEALAVAGESPILSGLGAELARVDVLVVGDEALLVDAPRALPRDGSLALVALADDDRAGALVRALPLRGWALLPTEATAGELQAAVAAAAQGLFVLAPPLAARLLGPRPDPDAPIEALTARETEVLARLSQGLPNKLIARELGISEHTVKFHVSSILAKLGASSRTDAVSRGARSGLVTL